MEGGAAWLAGVRAFEALATGAEGETRVEDACEGYTNEDEE